MLSADFRVDSPGSGTAAGRGLSNGGREGGLLERVAGDTRAGAPPAGEHAATARGCSTSRRRLARRPSRLARSGPLAHIGSRGSGDASSAAAAPCGVGAQTHTGAQGRGPSTLCSGSSSGTEHHRAEWLSVMAALGRRGGRHDRSEGVSGRFGPTYGVYRQIGPRATPSERCRGAGTAPVVPGQPPQPHTARHSRRSVRDARNDYRCARATARAWAQRRGVPRRSHGEADAPSAADGAPLRSGAPVEPALVRSGPLRPRRTARRRPD